MTGSTPRYLITGQSVGSLLTMAWTLGHWGIPIVDINGDRMVVETKICRTMLATVGCSIEQVPADV